MGVIRPAWIVRAAALLKDALVAEFSFAWGAPVGYWVFLLLCCMHTGSLPRREELIPPPVLVLFGAAVGGLLGIAVRGCHAPTRPMAWAVGFFLGGAVITAVILVAELAYAMSRRPY
jgi:hypothetical protein